MKKKTYKKLLCAAVLFAFAATAIYLASAAHRPETSLNLLKQSISCENGTLSFQIPEKSGIWNISIAGRIEKGGQGISVHYVIEESENNSWENGHTYTIDISGGGYTDLLMSATLEGTDASAEIDLMPYLPAE